MSSTGKQRTSTVKVGVLTLVSLGLLFFAIIWLRGKALSGGTQFSVYFDDVNGMREAAPVQMMGIRVGFVDEVTPVLVDEKDPVTHVVAKKYKVLVTFTVNKDVPVTVPKGSHLSIEQSGLIGEQFLEITPPRLHEVTLSLFKQPAKPIEKGMPVKFLYEQGYFPVGRVEEVRSYQDGNLIRYHLLYRITRPGAEMPEDPLFELTLDKDGQYYLRILPRDPIIAQVPEETSIFTVENPMRMKRFLEIQMESAEALEVTNKKLNQLMSDETIESLHSTLKNVEILTNRANTVMDTANSLFDETRRDMGRLISVAEQLSNSITTVSSNINDIIGDPKLKGEMTSTVASLRESSHALRDLLNDPALKETIQNTRNTSKDASELVSTLKQTVGDPATQQRMDRIILQLDTSLDKLNSVLNTVDESVDGKDERLKGILEDTRAAAKNLRDLTGKFSGHFTLFKLLF
jgi:phospholipid/cholesterol/gamma-HCH transport system substrate-binding protein